MSAEVRSKVFGMPHNVGVGVACFLGLVVLYEFYDNVIATPSYSTQPAAIIPAPSVAADPTLTPGPDTATRSAKSTQRRGEEFSPKLHSKRPEDRIDPRKVDPTLRLDLLAKVQAVQAPTGRRNLFQLSATPPKPVEMAKLGGPEPRIFKPIGPPAPPPEVKPGPPPPPPPPPPIPLKFYGFTLVRASGKKMAYFMDGEEILLAPEGETVKRRYRVVRINANSVLMEDTESKHQQTLPLTEESQG